MKKFEKLIEKGTRKKGDIYGRETRTCEDSQLYGIRTGIEFKKFSESWTKVYTDKCERYTMELVINGEVKKILNWARLDGGRYFVPIPKGNGDRFYWEKNSLEFKVAKAIGGTGDIEKVAKESGIEII